MLRIAWQTLRARRATLAGAFVAIWLAVTLAYAAGLLMTGALSAPGPGRYDAADAVVRADPTVQLGGDLGGVDVLPAPRLGAELVERAAAVPGVARAVGDVAFPAGLRDARGAAWASTSTGTTGAAPPDAVRARRRRRAGGAARRRRRGRPRPARRRPGARDHRRGRRRLPRQRHRARRARRRSRPGGAVLQLRPGARPLRARPGTSRRSASWPRTASPAALHARLGAALGGGVEVLDRAHAADADPGSPLAGDREQLIAMFGTLAGIAGVVALFVVAGTFALAIAQRRRETAVLRALGATPRQVRRLIAAEALLVSAVATALGVAAGAPLAQQIVDLLADHGTVPRGFAPVGSWIPLAGAIAMGLGIAQLAVVAAARRAGRTAPAEALREAAIEHARPGVAPAPRGRPGLAGGATLALAFSGSGRRRSPCSAACCWRPASGCSGGCARRAGCDAAWPLRRSARRACSRAPASRRTAGARRRSRRRSC